MPLQSDPTSISMRWDMISYGLVSRRGALRWALAKTATAPAMMGLSGSQNDDDKANHPHL